jgi:flavin-dependent dehydrogenase
VKYDLIIAGGGPAGLMAAATAAADGLKVLLLERKKDITATPRADASIFYWKFNVPDEYVEPINVTLGTGRPMLGPGTGINVTARFDFPGPGCSWEYDGPILNLYNYVKMSSTGRKAWCIKNELWGFYFSREEMLRSLLKKATATPAEIVSGAYVAGVENTAKGVNVRVRTAGGEVSHTARKVIAADGLNSIVVESLGLNRGRTPREVGAVCYILEGVEPDVRDPGTYIAFDVPSISHSTIFMGLHAEGGNMDLRQLTTTETVDKLELFMKHPRYASWFAKARLVRKTAVAATLHNPTLAQPVAGNVLIVGDAICAESFVQGAIAGGYQAAKAVSRELNGQPGFEDYTRWMHKSFAFFSGPDHFRQKTMRHLFAVAKPDEDDVEYIYKMIEEKGGAGHPAVFALEHMEILAQHRPAFHQRLKQAMDAVEAQAAKGGWQYNSNKAV